jgi:hypothetical protein
VAASGFLRRFVVEACVAACLAPFAQAATFTVDVTYDSVDVAPGDGLCVEEAGRCSLRAAVQEANALPGIDTVILTAADFRLTITGSDEDLGASGALDVTESLVILGAARDDTTIEALALRDLNDPQSGDRVFDVHGGALLTLRDLTVAGGFVAVRAQGGGIRLAGSNLDAADVAIRGNFVLVWDGSEGGGGIFASSGSVTLTRVLMRRNAASDDWFEGGGVGGALLADPADVTIVESQIDGNKASDGAGIAVRGGSLVLRDSTVSGGDGGPGRGAGLALGIDVPAVPPTVTIERSTIAGNFYARVGGGIDLETGSLVMRNSTIAGNDGARGGGLHVGASAVAQLWNVTIAGNVADGDFEAGGGGVMVEPGARVTAANVLVADNTCDGVPGTVGADWQGEMTSLGHDLVEDASMTVVFGDRTGVILGVDPGLRLLRDNGGSTATIMLNPGSSAIDAGDPIAPGGGDPACEATDQRLVSRPFGPTCDIGAVEYDCFDAVDSDSDGIGDACDTCPSIGDAGQGDLDSDGDGDVCDADDDGDGVLDVADDCPRAPDEFQGDWDGDGIGDACDNCPGNLNAFQDDQDADGTGDACDNCPLTPSPGQQDNDYDTIGDACDTCTDFDHDGFGTAGLPASTCPLDNCVLNDNPLQEDVDGDGIGDICDYCTEPSAGDLSPLALPLRVTKVAASTLRVSWWVPTAAYVDVYRGTLPTSETLGGRAARGPSAYDHDAFGACNLLVTELDVVPAPGSEYFLVGAHCWLGGASFATGSLGRDSFGSEIPPALNQCP